MYTYIYIYIHRERDAGSAKERSTVGFLCAYTSGACDNTLTIKT